MAAIPKKKSRLKESQKWTMYLIGGKYYKRIPFGEEKGLEETEGSYCETCGATNGMLHSRGCSKEQCR